jgi:chromate reductase, NAD(P)H dehydrogenase (quinone)
MKMLGISGSLHSGSSNTALLRLVAEAMAPRIEMELFASLDDLPHFSPDRDRGPVPPGVAALRAAVIAADAVVVATPEYAGGMPGVLKNGLDWLVGSGELYEKPVVVVSAAPSPQRGGNAREWLERCLRTQGGHVCDSFTVAVVPREADDTLAVKAAEAAERITQVLTSGRCGELAATSGR